MNNAKEVFLDPKSADAAVLGAVAELKSDGPLAELWIRVANDSSYSPFHRAVAIHQLFGRYVVKPITLGQVAQVLDGGNWLMEAEVEKIEEMGGEIPVRIPTGGKAYVIRCPRVATSGHPEVGVYLALDRDLDARLLRDGISGVTDEYIRQTNIVDIAVFPENLVSTKPP